LQHLLVLNLSQLGPYFANGRVLCNQDNEMVIGVVHGVVTQTLTNWQSSEVRDIELAVTLLYQLGEALPVGIMS
jgi:hypothetical protein